MNRIKEKKRVKEIISVFVKYGLKKERIKPENLRLALEELGPTYIKLGQILSTRSDIIPQSYILEFEKLQDSVKPLSYDVIHDILEENFGDKIDDVFIEIDHNPIASASIAQVHKAIMKDGTRVALKILRPNIREIMLSDMKILKRFSILAKLTPQGHIIDIKEAIDFFIDIIEKELDLNKEAQNLDKFYENNIDSKLIKCPKVFKEYSNYDILVMEYIDGIKITNINKLKQEGYDLEEIASKLAYNFLKQVFEDGFFHGDPHPGNIIINNRKIVFFDFGAIGIMDKDMQKDFNNLLLAIGSRDIQKMTHAVLKIGIKRGKINIRKLYSDIEEIYGQYIDESLLNINVVQIINDVTKAAKNNNIAMPVSIMMFVKGMMILEGVIEHLAPDMSIMDVAIPYIQSNLIFNKDIKKEIIKQLNSVYTSYRNTIKLPTKTLEVLNTLNAGKLKIKLEHLRLERSVYRISKMINRVVVSLIISSIVIGSSLVINANAGPKIYDMSFFGLIGYLSAGLMGIWLVISMIRSGKM
ncbi:ABC1 kinase family protein [Abyssisolibacter fermentans]|uniref:ABC1 kinase family protein n=1 Tax=Abyssisolibacter fermentans TaxID=1766203 RepID=UPI0012E346CA|nr:AarF/ABC1/UbiB kinase family protein [Abyssisolibacter fermentans]